MQDKEDSPEINPVVKRTGLCTSRFVTFSIIFRFRVKNVKSCNYKLRFQFELYHTEKALKSKEMNFSKQQA